MADEFVILYKDILGSGSFAKVFKGAYKKKSVAVKVFHSKTPNIDKMLRNEAILMRYTYQLTFSSKD
jgi:predicted unusual protein kinase regulating ubiquinone biosynthesis (AarF/ABC1/UbiB family)